MCLEIFTGKITSDAPATSIGQLLKYMLSIKLIIERISPTIGMIMQGLEFFKFKLYF